MHNGIKKEGAWMTKNKDAVLEAYFGKVKLGKDEAVKWEFPKWISWHKLPVYMELKTQTPKNLVMTDR